MNNDQEDVLVNNIQLDEESFEYLIVLLNRVKLYGHEVGMMQKIIDAVHDAKTVCLCREMRESSDLMDDGDTN